MVIDSRWTVGVHEMGLLAYSIDVNREVLDLAD